MTVTTQFGSCEVCNEDELVAFLTWYAMQLTAWLAEQYELRRRAA